MRYRRRRNFSINQITEAIFLLFLCGAFNCVQSALVNPGLASVIISVSVVLLVWGLLLGNRYLRIKRAKFLARQSLYYDYTPSEFERVTGEIFRSFGFNTMVTAGADDRGIDIILTKNNQKIGVQCKRYKNAVGPAPIREFVGALEGRRFDTGFFVTTSSFTQKAKEAAERSRAQIELFPGNKLVELQLQAQNQINTDLITADWWGEMDKYQRFIISGLATISIALVLSIASYIILNSL